MVFNGGDFKKGISFSFRIPPGLPKGDAVAASAAVTAQIEKKVKKSCDTSILWFSMVGISKMGSVFLLGYPPRPRYFLGEAKRGGAETYVLQKIKI